MWRHLFLLGFNWIIDPLPPWLRARRNVRDERGAPAAQVRRQLGEQLHSTSSRADDERGWRKRTTAAASAQHSRVCLVFFRPMSIKWGGGQCCAHTSTTQQLHRCFFFLGDEKRRGRVGGEAGNKKKERNTPME